MVDHWLILDWCFLNWIDLGILSLDFNWQLECEWQNSGWNCLIKLSGILRNKYKPIAVIWRLAIYISVTVGFMSVPCTRTSFLLQNLCSNMLHISYLCSWCFPMCRVFNFLTIAHILVKSTFATNNGSVRFRFFSFFSSSFFLFQLRDLFWLFHDNVSRVILIRLSSCIFLSYLHMPLWCGHFIIWGLSILIREQEKL